MSDLEQLVRVSRLYYELGETQSAIADLLGVTRPQVSRLLKRARAEGIVEIRIVDGTTAESPAAETLVTRFGLDAVHLAPSLAGPDDLTRRMVGRRAAEVLRDAVRAGSTVGVGDGASVAATAAALEDTAMPVAVTVVPLCGGYWSTGQEHEPYRRIADALDGQARGLMAPGLVDDAATKRALVAHAGVRAILELWERLDVALSTASAARPGARPQVGEGMDRDLEAAGAVGEILVAPFDLDGRFVCDALRERVIAFDARDLGRIPVVDRRGVGREQGAPDPRGAAVGRRPDARDRRRDGRGRRRARRREAPR